MPDYAYEAMGATGDRTSGTLTANNERDVVAMLDARGLFPVKVQASTSAAAAHWGRKVRSKHLTTLYSQMADLLHSGVPLLRSLELMERQTSQPALKETLRDIRADVADGTSLADAMNKHPRAFNELTVSMIRAGQEGGFLEDVLKRIAAFNEQQEDLKSQVIGSLVYPIVLAIVGFIVLNVLVIFFVPKFEPIFKKLQEKDQLPALTTGLLSFSHALQSYGIFILLGLFAAVWFFRRWARTEHGRYRVDGWRLRIPIVGAIYRNLALARFTRILGTLMHNGIPILQSLRISKDSTGNKVLANAIDKSADNVTAGEKLAAPLANNAHFPRDLVEMIAVAEEANTLETVLVHIADGLEKRTRRSLEIFVRLLEPMMLLVMGGATLIVVLGLLLPVFKISSVAR
jgi:general secretion pathway protein F